jgi:DNA-binding transcriptional LysR family regulator
MDAGNDTGRWSTLELRHLLALHALAERGTFAGAAALLGYTQSAISQQIRMLERITGQRVVERPRGRRPTGLTEAGKLLLRHSEAIMARVNLARTDLAGLAAGTGGPLRIGTYQSTSAHVLPAVLRRFARSCPQVRVWVHEATTDAELYGPLEQGDLDLTFVMLPNHGPFQTIGLLRDPYVAVVAAGSPLATRGRPLSLRELATLPLISFRTCRNEQRVKDYLHTLGVELNVVQRSDDNTTIQALGAGGLGVALAPSLATKPSITGTAVVELEQRLPPRLLGIAWHRDRQQSPATAAFISISAQVCAELQETIDPSPGPHP